jgi:hypothetical protein
MLVRLLGAGLMTFKLTLEADKSHFTPRVKLAQPPLQGPVVVVPSIRDVKGHSAAVPFDHWR